MTSRLPRPGLRVVRLTVPALLILASLLAGCGGGGSDDGTSTTTSSPPPATADALVANAGPGSTLGQQTFAQVVSLDGVKSFFRADEVTTRKPATALWEVVSVPAGATVTGLPSSATTTAATIPANAVLGTYRFRLTVAEGSLTAADTVDVVVKKFIVKPLSDRIQIGFSTSSVTVGATIAASVTGNATAPTFSWSGVLPDPFMKSVTGASSATLSFVAPRVDELENLPGRATILGMWAYAAGYRRLTVTATEGGVTASADVILSYGIPTSGNKDVPMRAPVYLCGAPTGPWSWQFGSIPGGSSTPTFYSEANVSLGTSVNASADARIVWFQPASPGLYTVIVVSSATAFVLDVNAAEYLSDGLHGTAAPDPDLGQCGGCHGGSVPFLEDKVTPYLKTRHAGVAEAVFEKVGGTAPPGTGTFLASAPELSYVTTGFHLGRASGGGSFTAANGGFDDVAASQGALVKPLDLATLARKYPETARLANVQCEVCHGPGSLHFGDSEAIGVNIKADACAQCHDAQPREWASSAHSQVVASPSTNPSCTRCHTAVGAMDPRATGFTHSTNPSAPNPAPSIPVPDETGRAYTATCATCHDPHSADHEHQLRLSGTFTLLSGATIEVGNAKSCFQCHNSRRAIGTPSTVSGRSAPHDGTQSDIISGTNLFEFPGNVYPKSAHGLPSRFVYPVGSPKEGKSGEYCIACHMGTAPAPGVAGHGEIGGHSFALRSEDGQTINTLACTQCHTVGGGLASPRGPEFDVQAAGDYDGNGNVQSIQLEIAGLMKALGGSTAATASAPFGTTTTPTTLGLPLTNPSEPALVAMARLVTSTAKALVSSSGSFKITLASGSSISIPAGADGDLLYKAMWNYYIVNNDGSFGIHNPRYAAAVLQATLRELHRRLGRAEPPFVPSGIVQ